MKNVADPQCSTDGKTVAYTVSQIDVKEDRNGNAHIWMIDYDGSGNRQVTSSEQSESAPRWSPDGKYLSFTSSRPGPARGNQVWLLPLSGGEALQLTDTKGRLTSYEWSPDSKKLALVIGDPDPDAPENPENGTPPPAPTPNAGGRGGRGGAAPKPIVIDRYKFKQDAQGYLLSGRHSYIYLFDIAAKKLDRLTSQKTWDEGGPSWSPDGKWIAFTSNHRADPDRIPSPQVYVAEAKAGATEKALTEVNEIGAGGGGRGGRVEWSHDGKWLAFLLGEEKKWGAYSQEHLAIAPADGSSKPTLVPAALELDRGVSAPSWSDDGKSIFVTVSDDMSVYGARVPVTGGHAEPLFTKPVVLGQRHHAGGCAAVISGGDTRHNEIYAFDNGALRQLTHVNDDLMAEIDWAKTEEVRFKSKDGTEIHGLLTYPLGYQAGTKVPFLLRIHGGPKGQDAHSLSQEAQWFAANGYAVLRVNYRGSDGRGSKFQRAIAADWGHYEVEDLEAGVDHVIRMGVADPDRMGVGGWSYGGILTDYMIATDTRFRAATSGAGTAFTVSFYGTDQYIIQYDNEIGPPWTKQGWDAYVKISYPFLHADRIKTPTMFLGGERDFNVPIQGGQQMYQALRSLGIDTQLIIYPNEFHGIQRPSYVRDRYERYLAWYDKYLKKAPPAAASTPVQDPR
ncbi:MAG TPA: S9 family peptidase [Bryobacteraceae bacterium]|nr:S9 family peptidase [Bryobacteraceae bacterium]